jgi:cyclophilin family peptidyl-prolyl cis-trans isomerase
MRRVIRRLGNLFGSAGKSRPDGLRSRSTVRLEVLALEDRLVPALGTLTGMVSANAAVALQGIQVTLTGNGVNLSTTTDGQGDYAFRSLTAGTYQVTALAGGSLSQGNTATVTVVNGQVTTQNLSTGGLAPGLVSLRNFLNTPIVLGGFGLPAAGPSVNSPPVVSNPIANTTLTSGASQTIDLAGVFTDPNLTNSQVVFHTSDGDMTVNLFDPQAPQTVANFFDYVGRYTSTIFHRLDTNPPVLQGGGFGLPQSFTTVDNPSDPQLANEFSLPDTLGTLAMAKLKGNPNSATSQFFFNLADNSITLGAGNNGGFMVFGSVASDATSQAVFKALQATPTQDESAFNSAFNPLPISASANLTAFPTNTTPADYLTINSVQVVKQDEALSYSVVSSNPSVVSAQFVPGHPEVLQITSLGPSGTATITVRATTSLGATLQTTFQVTV